MSNVFGTPKFGNSGGDFKKTRTVGAGDTYFRALPPMFSLRDAGEWRKYFATHWGYEAVSDRDPSKKFQKPFRCILDKDRRTQMIRQDCPACTKREQVEKERADKEKAIRAQMVGKDEAVIVARLTKELASIDEWLEDHRVDGKWYVNAKFKDGTFGSIKLNHKFHMSRILEIINGRPATADKPAVPGLMEAEGINPLDPAQGVWFVVSRTGTKRSVVDSTNIEVENVIGEVEVNGVKQKRNLKQIVLAPLTEEECEKAGKDCEDLASLGGAALTYEQIEALVNGTDAPEEIDEPLSAGEELDLSIAARQAAAQALEAAKVAKAAAEAEAQKAAAAASAPAPAASAAQNEAIQKRLAEIQVRKAAAEAEAAKKRAAEEEAARQAAAAAVPAGDPFANMSDEEFARTFGPGAGA
jgi:hypothetical protein